MMHIFQKLCKFTFGLVFCLASESVVFCSCFRNEDLADRVLFGRNDDALDRDRTVFFSDLPRGLWADAEPVHYCQL